MKQFKFRLEKVLRYKIQLEDRKKQALSERNAQLNQDKNSLLELHERKSLYQKKYSSLFHGKINIYGLIFSKRFLDRLNGEITQQEKVVKNSEEKVAGAKRELHEAMRERKKFERVKEKKRYEYEYESGREEQKEFDELASKRGATLLTLDDIPI